MPRQERAGGKRAPLQRTLTAAEIEKLLDEIDQAMLSGDERRMTTLIDRVPEDDNRIAEMMAARIIEGRAQVPLLEFELLGIFAGAEAPDYLNRIAGDSRAPDIVRFGAQRRLGWPERGEKKRRLAFLEMLRDAELTLVQAAAQGSETWPLGIDLLVEVLGYLEALPTRRRQALIRRIAAELGTLAEWLLQGAVHIPDEKFQLIVLEELVRLRPVDAATGIDRLARTGRTSRIRNEATAAGRRLRLRPVDHQREEERPLALPPLERMLMSEIDGDGGQVIVVVRKWGEGAYLLANIFHNDHWGIKSAFGSANAVDDQVDSIVGGLQEDGISLVDADLAAARGALTMALEVNTASGHTLPPAFALWEPLLHDTYPPAADEPATVPELDDAPYAGRKDLLRSSDQLADHEFFEYWPLDSMLVLEAMAMVPPPSQGRLTDKQYRPLIEELVDPQTGAVLRSRLRRQAWLLDRAGDAKARDFALAVAAQLGTGRSDELVKQPFLRTLVQRSVDRALVRLQEMG